MNTNARAREISVLLQQCASGDSEAERLLFEMTYHELRNLAGMAFRGERRGHTLQPSVLVNEAFLRMPRAGEIEWKSSKHFFALAARAMRRALVDYANQQSAAKRPGVYGRVDLESGQLVADQTGLTTVLVIDEVLDEFAAQYSTQAKVVELHFFAGMTFKEIGVIIDRDERTAKRYWKFAQVWLRKRLGGPGDRQMLSAAG